MPAYKMDSEIFISILHDLIEENKQLKGQVEVMDKILHSYLPIIEIKNKEK